MGGSFLAVYKELYGLGLKSVDMLVISQIYEYQNRGLECYATNEQLSEWFGESVSTIKRTISKLCDLNIIERDVMFVDGKRGIDGKKAGNKQRVMRLNPVDEWEIDFGKSKMNPPNDSDKSWKGHNDPTKSGWKVHNEPTNYSWKGHNDPIIYNEKDNINNKKETNNTKEQEHEKRQDNRGRFYPSVDIAEFISSLGIDDYGIIYKAISGHPNYKELHDMFHNDYGVHISDFNVLREEMVRQRDAFAKRKGDHRDDQLNHLRNMSVEDIRDIVSSANVYSENMEDDEYDDKARMIRNILKDRFGLSYCFTKLNPELCATLFRFAQSGDRDRFIEDTEDW